MCIAADYASKNDPRLYTVTRTAMTTPAKLASQRKYKKNGIIAGRICLRGSAVLINILLLHVRAALFPVHSRFATMAAMLVVNKVKIISKNLHENGL